MIRISEIYIGNPETLTTFFIQVRNFYLLGERDTTFTMLTIPSDPTTQGASHRPNWTRLGSDLNSLRPASNLNSSGLPGLESKSLLTAFFQNHQESQPIVSGHDVIHTPVPFPIWGFYYDIWDCHILCAHSICALARALARALSWIVLSLTKPNDKI